MSKLPDRDPHPQDHAVRIVAAAIEILRTRDGVPLTDEQIDERARNAVTGLGADFDLVPRDPGTDGRTEAVRHGLRTFANVAVFVIALAASVLGCGGSSGGNGCVLCGDGSLSCGGPGSCPDSGETLPLCGVIPGYSVDAIYCGGRTINGLRCTTQCRWLLGADASAEILDAGQISIPPGCTLPVDGVPGVCVTNCSECS